MEVARLGREWTEARRLDQRFLIAAEIRAWHEWGDDDDIASIARKTILVQK